jgi:hypothetical protein
MTRVAFVVPTIQSFHFGYCRRLIQSYDTLTSESADLYIIFSNESEKETFGSLGKAKSIVLPEGIKDVRNWTTVKKYYGLYQIYAAYDYVICMDDETMFTRKVDVDEIDHLWMRKEWWGSEVVKYSYISEGASRMFLEQDKQNLWRITNGWKTYIWWSNIPIYRCDNVERFFDYIGFKMENLMDFIAKIEWVDFDHIVYMYYCFLHEGIRLNSTTDIFPWMNYELENILCEHDIVIGKTNSLWSCNLDFIEKYPKMILLYHIDRYKSVAL